MKIALFGATGMIGSRILKESLDRGHTVTAIVRDPSKLSEPGPNLTVVKGDIFDTDGVAAAIAGSDVVVCAFSPRGGDNAVYADVARSLWTALKKAGVKRLITIGGAGSLEVAPGVQLVDTPQFPSIYKPRALAQREELNLYRTKAADLDWTYISPSAIIQPGERTGKFRVGDGQLLVDSEGKSHISAEDFAVALVNEIESAEHLKERFTVGY